MSNAILIVLIVSLMGNVVLSYLFWRAIKQGGAKMTENKPCPFCGCRLDYYDSRVEALKAWNRRAKDGRE